MKAMILAAGRGERMRPLTDTCPKPLLKIGGEPLIGWHLRRLKQAGITEIVINHAWLGEQIEHTLGSGNQYGVNIQYSPEPSGGLETAGGIATALPLLGTQPFLVINGDVLTDVDFRHAAQQAQTLSADGTLAHLWLVDNPEHNPKGDFSLFSDGLIRPNTDNGEALTFSGVGVYHPDLFQHTAANQRAKLAPILRQAMSSGQIRGEKHAGLWLDVGTVERLHEAETMVGQLAL
ncbi:N-acetylmuramate alpha-1-phosphate uridylyltransferase MurU [Neisseria lisongii]|uniref:Nucleotidyltransferase family protein n=1 Tax=Neisseria lisongii TaxID=2912188 RepID=A0AAW5AHM7_9NEIS|nr:nucleotidyltransferase family protein [Neisseria lisongii]MCF7529136.1 nucleotidyltransferase family protein [Neisseria lisongii]